MNDKLIEPTHVGDGLYLTYIGYAVNIAVNHHSNTVASIDMNDIDNVINYLNRVKERIELWKNN